MSFAIVVSGFDRSGRLFSEQASTIDISEAGCRFRVKIHLERGDVVAIRRSSRDKVRADAGKPLLFQIVWSTRDGDGWAAGALKLQSENIWHMAFPPSHRPKTSNP
jgi:hypothetical protein